jgi:hypothetical protein
LIDIASMLTSYYHLIILFLLSLISSLRSFERENARHKHLRLIQDCFSNLTLSSPLLGLPHEMNAMTRPSYGGAQVSWIGCILCAAYNQRDTSQSLRGQLSTSSTTSTDNKNKIAFDQIYKDRIWGDAGGGSGSGSDISMAFGAIYIIRLVLFKYGLTNLLDAPCGAVSDSWTKQFLITMKAELPCFRYHGVDVVSTVIEKNRNTLPPSTYPWISFTAADISSSTGRLPDGYDMILSRDALQHLHYSAIAGALSNYCRSGAKYLLVGSYIDLVDKNKDLGEPGGCFEINLLVAPFNFPQPLEIFAEKAKEANAKEIFPTKYLLLYTLTNLCQSSDLRSFIQTHAV